MLIRAIQTIPIGAIKPRKILPVCLPDNCRFGRHSKLLASVSMRISTNRDLSVQLPARGSNPVVLGVPNNRAVASFAIRE